jgi:ABC-type spermidine/putrescine transport system permease subunit II
VNRRNRPGWFLWAIVGFTGFVLVAPTLILIPMGFSSAETFAFPPPGWSDRWYRNLVDDPVWRDSIVLSFKVCIIATPLALIIGTAAAFGLMRMGVRVRGLLSAGILAPLIVPQVLVALAIYGTFLKLQLNGTLRGLVFADTVVILPYVVIAVMARLQGHDSRLRDAGLSLGAKPMTVFFRITFPLVLPGILAAALLAFVSAFDEFIIALLLQGPTLKTLSVQMYDSVALEIDPTISAAATIIVIVVSIVILSGQLFATRKKKVDVSK